MTVHSWDTIKRHSSLLLSQEMQTSEPFWEIKIELKTCNETQCQDIPK